MMIAVLPLESAKQIYRLNTYIILKPNKIFWLIPMMQSQVAMRNLKIPWNLKSE